MYLCTCIGAAIKKIDHPVAGGRGGRRGKRRRGKRRRTVAVVVQWTHHHHFLFHHHHHRRVQRLNGDRGFDGGRHHGLHLSLGNVWVGELHHLLFPPPRADRGILRDFVAHRRFLFAAALLFFVTKHAGTDGAAAAQHEDDDDDDDDPYWSPTATATKV
jgi:hypothetical protein